MEAVFATLGDVTFLAISSNYCDWDKFRSCPRHYVDNFNIAKWIPTGSCLPNCHQMDQKRNYSLYIDGLEDAFNAFVSQDKALSLSIERKPSASVLLFRITKGKTTGVVNVSLKKNGLVSMLIQGAPRISVVMM